MRLRSANRDFEPGPYGSPVPAGPSARQVAASVAVGAGVFFVSLLICVLVALAVVLAVSDRRGQVRTADSAIVGLVFCLVTAGVCLGAAFVVGRRLPDPPAGDWAGLMTAAATPVGCYLLLALLSLGGSVNAVAIVLQVAGLLSGSAAGAWLGRRANPHL